MTRAHLLLTSALVLAAVPAWAQTTPPPNQLPTGMRVIAGQASASSRGNTLQVTQGSNRAALDWSSFDIGSQASVRFQDPSSRAMTLNRVSGPNASAIAGRLTSNGQIVLINPSGVVFMPGSVVDAQSVVVSAAGITEAGMRRGVATGHFVLDQPARPGARVQNSGRISVARAGLAALVAPQVANHGIISAAFGTVALAGVASHVVDLYGDGLLSIDVSHQTIQGAGGQVALVTNDGLIAARGGQVSLSTDAVEGVVDNLVEAGGTIQADGYGRRGGRVLIDAEGGTATVTGMLTARGLGSGTSIGGEIAVQASQQVNLASSAVVDASGRTGGGIVAIGTSLARARHGVGFAAPAAALVGIAPGARVSADALVAGQGGQVTVLSTGDTVTEGRLSARGGAASGSGGDVEVSGTLGLSLLGVVDVTAAHGPAGRLTIDPTDLVVKTIASGGATLTNGTLDVEPPPPGNTATIDPTVLQAASGSVTLISNDNLDVVDGFSLNSNGLLTMTARLGTITVGGAITNNGGGIVMTAGSDILVNAAIVAAGSIDIAAGGSLTQATGASITSTGSSVILSAGFNIGLAAAVTANTALNIAAGTTNAAGILTQAATAPLTSTNNAISLSAGAAGAITLNGAINAPLSVNLAGGNGVAQNGGTIGTGSLFSSGGIGGTVNLPNANQITTLGTFTVSGGGNFNLVDAAPSLTITQPVTVTGGLLSLNATGGSLSVDAALSTGGTGIVSLLADTDVTISAAVTAAGPLAITAAESTTTGGIVQAVGGALVSVNDAIALSAGSSIELNAAVTARNGSVNLKHGATFSLPGGVAQNAGSITTPSLFSSSGVGGSVSLTQAANSIDTLGTFTVAGGNFSLSVSTSLLTVTQPVSVTGGALTITQQGVLSSGIQVGDLAVDAALSTATSGDVSLGAASAVTIAAPVTAADLLSITAGTGGAGDLTQAAGGTLASTNGGVLLSAAGSIGLNDTVTAAGVLNIAAETVGTGDLVQNAGGGLTSTGSGIVLLAAGVITLDDAVTATNANLGSLEVVGATSIVQNAGSITTPLLFGDTQIGGSVSLAQPHNSIGVLAGINVAGGFTLADTATLTLGGGLVAGFGQTVSVTAPAIVFAIGNEGGGGFIAAAGGTVELSPASGLVTLGASTSGFSLTQFDLENNIQTGLLRIGRTLAGGQGGSGGQAGSVVVAGSFDISTEGSASTLELDAGSGGIAVNAGPLVVGSTGVLLLSTPGIVSQAAGAQVDAGTLAGIGTLGALELSSTGNTIGTLGAIDTGADEINVGTSGTLALAGPISTTGGLTLSAGGSISLAGALSAGTLSLNTSPGDVVWTNSFSAATITGSIVGNASLIDTRAGGTTLGRFSATTVTLNATGSLNIGDAVTAAVFGLDAGTLTENGGSLNGMQINAGPFIGILTKAGSGIAGNATLLGPNRLTLVRDFPVTGTLLLSNQLSLVVGAGVGGGSTTSLQVTATGGTLSLDAALVFPAAGGTLDLQADNLVVSGIGNVSTGTSSGTLDAIAVAPFHPQPMGLGGSVTPPNTLTLTDAMLATLQATTLEVGGIGAQPATASDLSVFNLSHNNLAGTATLQVEATGSLTETLDLGGVFSVDVLTGSLSGGGLVLADPHNAIGQIGSLGVGGSATLFDSSILTLGGAFSVPNGDTIELAASGLAIASGLGSVSAGLLGLVEIGPTAGQSVALGSTATGALVMGDLSAVTAATLELGNSFVANATEANQVLIAGNAGFAGTLLLDTGAGAGAGVSQNGGALSVGTLGGSSGGTFDVAGSTSNAIAFLGAIGATAIDIVDASNLQISGLVAAGAGPLSLLAPAITVDSGGGLSATGGPMGLTTDILVAGQPGAIVDVGVSPGTGLVTIAPDRGSVLTVGPGPGGDDLTNVTTDTIALNGGPGGIVFKGAVVPGAPSLLLNASNERVTETVSDSLRVGTLRGAAGTLDLPGGNAIGTLAGFTVGQGDFLLANSALIVSAPVIADAASGPQTITIQAPSITLAGSAQFSITDTSPSSELVLQSDAIGGVALVASVPDGTVLLERSDSGPQTSPTIGSVTAATLQLGSSLLTTTTLTLADLLVGSSVGTLDLEAQVAVLQTGSIVAPSTTLTGHAGSVSLTNPNNILAGLGNFATTGNGSFALADAAPLAVSGSVLLGGGTLSLTDSAVVPAGISLEPGSSLQAAELTLQVGGGGVAQDPLGVLGITTLAGSVAGDLTLDGTFNAVSTIASLSVGGVFRLADTAALTEATSGTLTAGTFAGTFGSDVHLDGTANAIGLLGAITAQGTLTLTDFDPILTAPVEAEDISLLVDGIGSALGGTLTATGIPQINRLRRLFASGGTVEIAPRDIGVLSLGAPPSGGGPFVAGSVLSNVDAALLRLGKADGQVRATGIAVNASVTVGSQVATVDLEAVGPGLVTEQLGATFGLSGTLIGNTGAVALTGGGNAVPTLGAYTTNGGSFALDDGGALAIEGDVVASGITLAVAGGLTLDAGSLLAPGGTVDLSAAGASEVNGIIQAATLDDTGAANGTFALSGANSVDVLGSWDANGSLTLIDDTSGAGPALLTLAGPVTATALVLRAASIALTGDITVSGGGVAVLVTTAGGVTQQGGTLSAGLLTSPGVAGDVLLGSAGNAIVSLGPFSAPGHAFTLADASPLAVSGTLSAGTVLLDDPAGITVTAPVVASLIAVRGGSLAIAQNGVLLASAGVVDLGEAGATESGGGVIRAATLLSGGTPSGAFVLNGANSIDTLGAFQMAPGGTLLLSDTTRLTLAGPLVADAVDLSTTAGGVAETSGSIATSLFLSSFGIAGGATLENGGNAVASLGNIAVTGGDFSLAQAGPLVASGVVDAADIAIRIGGVLQIGVGGALQASGTVDLSASGANEAASGVIAATEFDSTRGASGVFALGGANRVGRLGVFSDPAGALTLTDTQALTVAGPVTVADLALVAPSLTLDGAVTAQAMQVQTTTGDFAEVGGGSLSVGVLSSPHGIAGAATLLTANRIAALGDFSANGRVSLADATALAVTGAVSAPGGLFLGVTGNAVSEGPQGSVATPLLTGNAGSVALTQAGNAIGALEFTTVGTFALADTGNLTVNALSGTGATLAVASDLALAGTVAEAGATVSLDVGGAVSQTGGTLAAGLLEGSAGSLALPALNAVSAIGDFAAPGGFTLANVGALAIAGTLQAGVIDLSVAAGGITEPGGALVGGQLRSSFGILGDTRLTGANQLASIGPLIDGGRFQFSDGQALSVGNVAATTIDLSTSAGGISQNGPLAATTLTSSFGIAGGAQFGDAGNLIGTLGPMGVTGGDLVLANAQSLLVAGPVSAPDVAFAVSGTITQTGDIVAPGTLSTDSLGPYRRTGGALAVGTLTGRALSLADFGTGAAVQRIGAFVVNDANDVAGAATFSNFALSDATALTLAGPLAADYLRISATGTLIWSGDISTLGLPRLQQELPQPTDPGTYLQVVAGSGGTAQILQIGAVHVFSQDAGLSTVRLQLPSTGGAIAFNDLQAPNTDLLLFTGAGRATGSIDVGDLLVSGALGGTDLVGTVRGLVGAAAARNASLTPFLNASYRLNSCPIQSVNCILLPVETVPQQNPLHDLAIGQAQDELDDTDVLLPNVAEQDY